MQVVANSFAAQAGLQAEDVMVKMDEDIRNIGELSQFLIEHQP